MRAIWCVKSKIVNSDRVHATPAMTFTEAHNRCDALKQLNPNIVYWVETAGAAQVEATVS